MNEFFEMVKNIIFGVLNFFENMNDKVFTIICTLLGFLISYLLYRYQTAKTREEEAYKKLYYAFYVLWDSIHQGRAFDYYHLQKDEQERIVSFFNENELYADGDLRNAIYVLKTCRLDDFNQNNNDNIKNANMAYREIVDIIIKREEKLRKKYIKVHDSKIQKTDFTDPKKFVQDYEKSR